MKWLVTCMLGASLAVAMATSSDAQQLGSESEAFLSAIRSQDGAKAETIAAKLGASVVNYRGYDGETPLTLAMAKRNGNYVAFLISKGAQPDLPDKRGDTGLIIAARSGFFEGVEQMLSARAMIDAANRQGETALIVAVQGRHAQVVRRLLERGANPDKTDIAAGYSARDYARRETRNRELLRMIETIKPTKKVIMGPVRN